MSFSWSSMAIVDCVLDVECPVVHADKVELRGLMTLGFAVAPVRGHAAASCDRVRGCRAAGERRSSADREGVPVVLPVRDGSPGGPYGTTAERHVLRPAGLPIEAPLAVVCPAQSAAVACSR